MYTTRLAQHQQVPYAGAAAGGGQKRGAKAPPNPHPFASRRAPDSSSSPSSANSSNNSGTVGKRVAAGAPVMQSRATQSFLTRKGSEFGVVRPQQVKITSRYQILEKARGVAWRSRESGGMEPLRCLGPMSTWRMP